MNLPWKHIAIVGAIAAAMIILIVFVYSLVKIFNQPQEEKQPENKIESTYKKAYEQSLVKQDSLRHVSRSYERKADSMQVVNKVLKEYAKKLYKEVDTVFVSAPARNNTELDSFFSDFIRRRSSPK